MYLCVCILWRRATTSLQHRLFSCQNWRRQIDTMITELKPIFKQQLQYISVLRANSTHIFFSTKRYNLVIFHWMLCRLRCLMHTSDNLTFIFSSFFSLFKNGFEVPWAQVFVFNVAIALFSFELNGKTLFITQRS